MTADDKGNDVPVFTYWQGSDRSPISEMSTAWQASLPAFAVFGDADVEPIIEIVQPDFVETYRRIRLPAAKSDVARLLLLHKFGGLYVDCNMGLLSRDRLIALSERLANIDHIFVDRRRDIGQRHSEQYFLINGMLMSRPGSAHILDMARQAMSNLHWQRTIEARDGFTQYSIYHLCGPMLLTSMTMQPGTCNREVRRDLAGRVLIVREEEFPVERNRYQSYRVAHEHWSQRQKVELLFDP